MSPTIDDVRAAAARIAPYLHRTPTMTATSLGGLFGVRLAVKAELFQKTGSFKARGVFNALLTLDEAARERGLVTLSAGNHAAALAYGATALGTHAVVVMPAHASPAKVAATAAYGGEVVLTERPLMDVVTEVREERGLTLLHPFDDPAVIAGQGTVAIELLDDLPDVDLVLVPVGGGGLVSGVGIVVKALRPNARVVGVEPEGADAMARSLAKGEPVHLTPSSVADGLCAPFAGVHTLAAVQAYVDEVVVVPDDAIVAAMVLMYQRTKLTVEPAAAAALAPLLTGAVEAPGASVAVIATGGNVDPATLKRLL